MLEGFSTGSGPYNVGYPLSGGGNGWRSLSVLRKLRHVQPSTGDGQNLKNCIFNRCALCLHAVLSQTSDSIGFPNHSVGGAEKDLKK